MKFDVIITLTTYFKSIYRAFTGISTVKIFTLLVYLLHITSNVK